MSCNKFGKEIARANQLQQLQDADLFGISRSGCTYSITFTGLVNQLGVTGTLQDGSQGGATPVLASASANNYVLRGVTSGRGSAVALDAQDNIQINTQVGNAGTTANGAALINDVTASTILFKRLLAGVGVSVNETAESIIIENSELSGTTKTVVVNELADFPDPQSGVITLEGDTDYLIANDIATNNRFVLPSNSPCVIRASDRRIITLQSTTTDAMFTYTSPLVTFKDIHISAPNGKVLTPDLSTQGAIELFKTSLTASELGLISGLGTFAVQSVIYNNITNNGWVFGTDVNAAQFVSNFVVNIAAGTVLDLGNNVFNRFGASEFVIVNSSMGTTWLSGLANSGNIGTESLAIIDQALTLGPITPLNGISNDDARWRFENCNDIPDTLTDALGYLSSPETTTISAVDTPVVLNGNGAFVSTTASQMTVNINGRITYDGVQGAQLPIDANLTIEPVSGGAIQIGVYIAKNGVVIAESEVYGTASSGDPANIIVIWQDTAQENDFYEVWVENETNSTNLLVDKFVFRVN